MHILIATDGALDVAGATAATLRWYEEGDEVTVFTAVPFPREYLTRLGEHGIVDAAEVAKVAGPAQLAVAPGAAAAERLSHSLSTDQHPASTSPYVVALANSAASRTAPLVSALGKAGISAKSAWLATEHQTARTIIAKAKQLNAELIIIGSHGRGRFEGRLGSTGTKLVRRAPGSVLVIRAEQ